MERVTLTSHNDEELTSLILSTVLKALSLYHPHQPSESGYLNQSQAADFLQIPKSTLYSYTSKRLIPHYKRGKRLVFKQSDLEAWLAESKKKTVSEIAQDAHLSISKRGGKK